MGADRLARRIVLAVDDNAEALGALTDTLETAGLMALAARDGLSALDLLDRVTPDLILLDAMMPGPDGFETCRRIKSRPQFSLTPVVFLTGLGESDDMLNGLRSGGVDYVVKPIDQNVLLERIRVHIANADLVSEARAALDATGPGVFALTPAHALAWASHAAAVCLETEPGHRMASDLGVPLLAWLQEQSHRAISQCTTLRVERKAAPELEFRMVGRMSNGDLLIKVEEFHEVDEPALLSEVLGLSPREAEVLAWIARGKSNRDVGDILDLSTRTVTKHVEQIFQKLGVENRTAAALAALHVLKS
ncbi:MAG: DNA-binding response regulator [Pseudomonadota bacterium]